MSKGRAPPKAAGFLYDFLECSQADKSTYFH